MRWAGNGTVYSDAARTGAAIRHKRAAVGASMRNMGGPFRSVCGEPIAVTAFREMRKRQGQVDFWSPRAKPPCGPHGRQEVDSLHSLHQESRKACNVVADPQGK